MISKKSWESFRKVFLIGNALSFYTLLFGSSEQALSSSGSQKSEPSSIVDLIVPICQFEHHRKANSAYGFLSYTNPRKCILHSHFIGIFPGCRTSSLSLEIQE